MMILFQKFGLGLGVHGKSGQLRVIVSAVNGSQYFGFDIERGTLYTSSLGDTLRADVNASMSLSDTSDRGFGTQDGGGFSIDLDGVPLPGSPGDPRTLVKVAAQILTFVAFWGRIRQNPVEV